MAFQKFAAVSITAAAACLLTAGRASAAPPLTAIQDILYKADGTPFSGVVIIEWKTFEASDTSLIARNRVQQKITNGLLSVRLVPTTTAGTSAYYSVRYVSGSSTQFTEAWAVRPSSSPLRVADVRIPDPLLGPVAGGEQSSSVTIDQVTGLRGELDIRPRQGVGYMADRAVIINSNGELAAAAGGLSDCLRVDGTAGPCGTGETGGGAVAYVDAETPAGSPDGVNNSFTLSQAPNPPGSLLLYRNGLLMKSGLDYSLSGGTVTFVPGAIPQSGDVLMGSYRTNGVSAGFADAETPTGAVNGANAIFTLSQAPSPATSLLLHRNGLLMKNGLDYTLSGNTVQFVPAAIPQGGDVLVASYRVGN